MQSQYSNIYTHQSDFQFILNEVHNSFLGDDLSNFDDLVNSALQKVVDFSGLDRAFIYKVDLQNEIASNAYEYCAENIPSVINERKKVPFKAFSFLCDEHKKEKSVYISNTDLLSDKYDSELKNILKGHGVATIMSIPIFYKGKFRGFIGFEKFFEPKILTITEKNLFHIFSKILLNAEVRRRQEKYLKEQSAKNSKLLKELQKSTKDNADYTHLVAHELKSSLINAHTLLSWYITDKEKNLSHKENAQLSEVIANVEKIDITTNAILEYSKLNKEDINKQTIDLKAELSEFIKNKPAFTNADIIIQENMPLKTVDSRIMIQVFDNLIKNAIQFNRSKRPVINIGFEDTKKFYKLFVKDNGIGIDKKYHSKIFNIFEKLDSNSNQPGIGLALVKKAVALCQGEVWVESEPNKGATFYITLPKKAF